MLEINEYETKEEVHKLLSVYRRLELTADMEYSPNITQSFSADIKGSGGKPTSAVESSVMKKVDAESYVADIQSAVARLSPEAYRILSEKYLNKMELTDVQIYMGLNMSKSTFYRKLAKAQLDFAFAYNNGTLLALKRDTKETRV